MKKIFTLITLLVCMFSFSACDFTDGLLSKLREFRNDKTTARKTSTYIPLTNPFGTPETIFTPTNLSTFEVFDPYTTLSPLKGNVKALVIPVEFLDGKKYTANMQTILNQAFNENPNGYSLKSFYKESSYNQLNIESTIIDCYEKNSNRNSISDSSDVKSLVKSILSDLEDTMDLSQYDSDNDGYIDSIYLLYTHNYDSENDSVWWAFQSTVTDSSKYDGVKAGGFVWASIGFCNKNYSTSNVNALTYIHETAHLMGVDDYYDYNDHAGTPWGVGGFDIMDSTVGDHNPFTKLMLGWIKPQVVTGGSHSIVLDKFSTSGDSVVIKKSFNGDILTEFFIVDYFDYQAEGITSNSYITKSGIRIYHVNATFTALHINETGGEYPNIFDYDNSDTSYGLLQLIEKEPIERGFIFTVTESIMDGYNAHNDCLFYEDDVFNPQTINTNQFINTSDLGFTLKVVSLGDSATIEIVFS